MRLEALDPRASRGLRALPDRCKENVMDVRTHGKAPARGSFASGLKVTTIVVVVGVLLALADQSLVSTRDSAQAMPDTPAATGTTYATDGFAVPDELRARAGEAPAHVEAF
jgi:hypothetical protein